MKLKLALGIGIPIVAFFVILASIGMLIQDKTPKMSLFEIEDKALTLDYDVLYRNNADYVGKIISYVVEVRQVQRVYEDSYVLLVAVGESDIASVILFDTNEISKPPGFSYLKFGNDLILVNYNGPILRKGDVIKILGEFKGLKDYETLLGSINTVPEIDALAIGIPDMENNKIVYYCKISC